MCGARERDSTASRTWRILLFAEVALLPYEKKSCLRHSRASHQVDRHHPQEEGHPRPRPRIVVRRRHEGSRAGGEAERRPISDRLHVQAQRARVSKLEVTNCDLKFSWRPAERAEHI